MLQMKKKYYPNSNVCTCHATPPPDEITPLFNKNMGSLFNVRTSFEPIHILKFELFDEFAF
jgi:hypothetical protein